MKKMFLGAAAIGLLTGVPAFADDVSIGVNIGGGAPPSASVFIGRPPVVVAPQPVVVAPPPPVIIERPASYDPHHREHDRKYWQARKEQERRERERREHEHHDHDDRHDHYDHGER